MKHRISLVATAITSLVSLNAWAASANPADTVFYGGTVVTVNEKQPQVTGLAIKDGNIVAVGDQASILQDYVGSND